MQLNMTLIFSLLFPAQSHKLLSFTHHITVQERIADIVASKRQKCFWQTSQNISGVMLYIFTMTTPLSTAMAFHSHSNSHNQSYHSLDGATILSWAHDPDCQHTIA